MGYDLNMKMTEKTRPSEKFVQHILSTVADPKADKDNIRAVIEAVWEKTQTTPEKTSAVAVMDYVDAYADLYAKVERVRNVIRNTLRKRNLTTPDTFKWVEGPTKMNLHIHGIYRKRTAFGKDFTRVTDTSSAPNNTYIQVRGYNLWTKDVVANIPFEWLSLSDGEISKMVRNEVRAIAAKKAREELGGLTAKKKELERQLKALQGQIDAAVETAKKPQNKK